MNGEDALRVRLPVFEGPLELLYYLIRKHELDISEVSLANISDEFVAWIEAARDLNLGTAGRFISTASTLMYIKSKWLLPAEEEPGADSSQEDEVGPLLQRLADYQKLRDFMQTLAGLEQRARAAFHRPFTSELERRLEEIAEQEPHIDLNVFELLKSMRRVQEFAFPVTREVAKEEIPLEEKLEELTTLLRNRAEVNLSTLISSARSLLEAVVFFLAALELARQRAAHINQQKTWGEIRLKARRGGPRAAQAAARN